MHDSQQQEDNELGDVNNVVGFTLDTQLEEFATQFAPMYLQTRFPDSPILDLLSPLLPVVNTQITLD
jgi:hypothetical protein